MSASRTMYARPNPPESAKEAPVEFISEACGLYFRSLRLHIWDVVGQHSHDHAHATLVGAGRARGWCGEEWIGDKGPGDAFEIKMNTDHTFQALEPDTRLVCIHDIASAESVKRKES
jgi:hypothetical protein